MARDLEIPAQQGLDFYISYAGPDRLWAEWVGGQLRDADYTFELDLWHRLPGDNIILAREAALERADRVLALCSAAYFGGGFTEQDWTAVMAAQHRKPGRLIPIWIEDLDGRPLPDILRAVQPIKLFGMGEPEAAQRLLGRLAGDLGPQGTPGFPGAGLSAKSGQNTGSSPRLPAAGRPGIWRVPSLNPAFTGRDGMLVDVREGLMRASAGTVILQGPGGVGKTQLSIEYAHRFRSDYDTVWVFDGEQPELIAGQFAELAVALGAPAEMKDAQIAAAAALSALRDRKRWLLVFDNVEDPDRLTEFLPDGQGHVLVTTRVGGWQEIGTLIAVEEFSRAESTALLTTAVAGLSPAVADGVADALGDLPLALAQAAGILQSGMPAAEFLRLLDTHATQVLSEGRPRSYPATLAAATQIALDRLAADHPKAASLLCLCGYLAPEPIPATWFREPAEPDLPSFMTRAGGLPGGTWEASRAFGHIRDIGLGRVDQKGLRLHRLTQAILRDHTAEDQAAYLKAISIILTAATPPGSDDPAYWPDWSQLVPHLILIGPEHGSDAFRVVACDAARYLLVSGQAKAALAMTRRLYEVWAEELGADNPDTLTAAQHLVHALHDNGDYAKALDLQQNVLVARRRTLGEDHPDTLRSASDLAVTLHSLGRPREAVTLNQDTYDRRRRILGEDHPNTLTSAGNLAATFRSLGRSKEALPLDQDTYDRRRRILGEDHPSTLSSASNLASNIRSLGRSKEALPLYQDTYDRSRRVLGKDHPDTLTFATNLAGALYQLGQRAEALPLNQDTYDRRRRVLGEDHPDTLASASNLAANLEGMGRRRAALRLRGKMQNKRKK